MADEALACFQSILDSVPTWIADLESIVDGIVQRQNERLLAEQPTAPIPSRKQSKASKASSLRSNRSSRHAEQQEPTQPAQPINQTPHMTDFDALRLSQRKRKTASVCSVDESGPYNSAPSKYRTKRMVVVYYDGETQKQLESLVRAIGTRRNAVRKGKLSAKIDGLGRSGSSSSSSSSAGEEHIKGLGTFTYRTTTHRRDNLLGNKASSTEKAFDTVDDFLEKAQALCERASHQILRDGDCTPEVEKAKRLFNDAVQAVEADLPSLKEKAAKAVERRRLSEARQRSEIHVEEEPVTDIVQTDRNSFPSDGPLEVDGALEVDDDDEDTDQNEEMDLTTMRLPPALGKYQLGRGRNCASGGLTAF